MEPNVVLADPPRGGIRPWVNTVLLAAGVVLLVPVALFAWDEYTARRTYQEACWKKVSYLEAQDGKPESAERRSQLHQSLMKLRLENSVRWIAYGLNPEECRP